MDNFDYLCKLIIFGDRGVGRTTLEKNIERVHRNNRRDSFRDRISDFDKEIDEYRILREKSKFFLRRLYYSLRIKRETEKKNRHILYFESDFDSQASLRSTIGVSFRWIIVEIRGIRIKLLIWVLGYQEYFRIIRKMYVRGSSGAILLYDITNASSLNRIPEWREMIAEFCGEIPIVLIGNKVDLEEQRAISKERGIEVQKTNNLSSFMEISAETGENVEKMFELVVELILNDSLND